MELGRPDWMAQARCHGQWELFDAERGDRHEAVQVCWGCPVRKACDEYADLVADKVGVWAGKVQSAKASPERPKRPRRGRAPIMHGTRGGFQAHRRRNEQPCEQCRQAMDEVVRANRAGGVWSQRAEQIREMTSAGRSLTDIAAALRVTPRTVTRYKQQLGIAEGPTRSTPPNVLAIAHRLLREGCSYGQAAAAVGVHRSTLQKHFPGMGMEKSQAGQQGGLARWAS